jgi:hypothetical protein
MGAIAKTLAREGCRFLILSRGLSLQLRRPTRAKLLGIGCLLAPGPPFRGPAQPIGQPPLCVASELWRVECWISLHEGRSRPMLPKGNSGTVRSLLPPQRPPRRFVSACHGSAWLTIVLHYLAEIRPHISAAPAASLARKPRLQIGHTLSLLGRP